MFEANGNRMKPAHATVTISKPITPEDYANMDIKELTKHTQVHHNYIRKGFSLS